MPGTEIQQSAASALVQRHLADLASGAITVDQLAATLAGDPAPLVPQAPSVPAITDAQRDALARLPEVYGQVAPSRPRALTQAELRKLVIERELLDVILSLVSARKKVGINEIAHNHLDRDAERRLGAQPEDVVEDGVLVAPATPRDRHGHYLVKGADGDHHGVPVEGTGKRFVRQISGGRVRIDSAALLAAYRAGVFSHEEYLALTVLPETPRVFDEAKARAAIRRDPALLARLAKHATVQDPPTVALYLREDKS